MKDNEYKLRQETRKTYVISDDLWREVEKLTGDQRYLVQKAVNSVTKHGRHFDLRCHALRINGVWKVGGMCGRLGKRGSVVTTSHSGGTLTVLKTLFTRDLKYSQKESAQMIRRLNSVVLNNVNWPSSERKKMANFLCGLKLI